MVKMVNRVSKENKMKFRRGQIVYNEEEMLLGLKMLESLEKITDMMLFLLKHRNLYFSYILIGVNRENLESILLHRSERSIETLLRKEKRETDLLIPIDKEKNIYVIICQETKIEGGYIFSERLIRELEVGGKKGHLYQCSVLTVTSLHYSIRQIIYYLLDIHVSRRHEKTRKSQISLRTI